MAQYVITDGNYYLRKDRGGSFTPIKSVTLASNFTRQKAESVLNNQISKNLRKRYHIECIEPDPKGIKSVTKSDLVKTEKVVDSGNIQKWLERIRNLNGLINDATDRKEELCKELSIIDKQLSDIYHYIEFSNLNAYQGYQAAKMIKDRRIIRRRVKDELNVVNMILEKRISETVEAEVLKCIKGMDNRTYNPRVLKEMFEL